jgi:hypothetical protein
MEGARSIEFVRTDADRFAECAAGASTSAAQDVVFHDHETLA